MKRTSDAEMGTVGEEGEGMEPSQKFVRIDEEEFDGARGKKENKKLKEIIYSEVSAAVREGRDFNFSKNYKKQLLEEFGLDAIASTLLAVIRETNTLVADPFNFNVDLTGYVRSVKSACETLTKDQSAWSYTEEDGHLVTFQAGEKILLVDRGTQSKALSTILSGYERYTEKCSKAPTPAENWARDDLLMKRIRRNFENANNMATEALSRNRIRVGVLLSDGCRYPTAFPISIVLWILKQEASRRPNGRLHRFIDPCAGWGDRLAGALIAGPAVVENYLGIDPWHVSNRICERIVQKFDTDLVPAVTALEIRSEPAQVGNWPDADLVFTSPPYAALELYNYDPSDTNPVGDIDDGQAWRLALHGDGSHGSHGGNGKFKSEFLLPLMQNAANATRRLQGRVIINLANTSKKDGGETLTRDLRDVAESVGLKLVDIFGMRLSERNSSKNHGAAVKRGEPFFVFEHTADLVV